MRVWIVVRALKLLLIWEMDLICKRGRSSGDIVAAVAAAADAADHVEILCYTKSGTD